LSHELEQLKRILFKTRSERFEPVLPDQTSLFETVRAPETEPAKEDQQMSTTRRDRKKKPVRQVLLSHLPREEIIEPEIDTTGLRRIGSEVTETLDYRSSSWSFTPRKRGLSSLGGLRPTSERRMPRGEQRLLDHCFS
jgi:transposase